MNSITLKIVKTDQGLQLLRLDNHATHPIATYDYEAGNEVSAFFEEVRYQIEDELEIELEIL